MELEELFESYTNGTMSEADASLFEKLVKENPEYQNQFDKFKGKKTEHSKIENQPIQSKSKFSAIKAWGISVGIALAIVLAGYFLFKTLGIPTGEKLFNAYYEPKQFPDSLIYTKNPMILDAMTHFEKKEFSKAAVLLEKLKSEGDPDFARFYLGLCELELDRPEKAIPSLSLVSQKSDYFLEATWYGAMSFLKMNKLEEAKRLLNISEANPNQYSEKAEEILKKMN